MKLDRVFTQALQAFTLAASLASFACVNEVYDPEGHGDDAPEFRVAGDELDETFTRGDDGLLVSPALAAASPSNQVALMATLAPSVDVDALPSLRVRATGSSEWRDAEWTFTEQIESATLVAGRGVLDGEHDAVEIAIDADDADLFLSLTFAPAYALPDDADIDAVE